MKKKLLVGILVLTMLVACLGVSALAAAAKVGPHNVTSVKIQDKMYELKTFSKDPTAKPDGSYQYMYFTAAAVPSYATAKVEVTGAEGATLSYAAGSFSVPSEFVENVENATKELTADNCFLWIKAVVSDRTEYIYINIQEKVSTAEDVAMLLGVDGYTEGDIKLDGNVEITKPIKIEAENELALTIDLNGKKISGEVNGGLLDLKNVNLTIKDSSETTKGSIDNTYVSKVGQTSAAVVLTSSKLKVEGGVTISGYDKVISASGKSEISIDGASIKVTGDKDKNYALSGRNTEKLTIADTAEDKNVTAIYGQWSGTWSNESSISGGYFTFFQVKSKAPAASGANEPIFGANKGFVALDAVTDKDYINDFTYKVGDVDAESAEAYVKLDDNGDSKLYGTVNDLVKFYQSKTIYVQNNATLNLNDFGDVVGGKYDGSNTLTFEKAESGDPTLTIEGTVKVALIKCGTTLKVSNKLDTAKGFTSSGASAGEYKYDISEDNTAVVVEVTFDTNTYKYTAESLGAMFREIQGKTATVKLLKDVTYDQQIALTAASTKLTLDLNGHTYKYDKSGGAAFIVGKDDTAVELKITDTNLTKAAGGVLDASGSDEAICVGDFKAATEKRTATNKLTIAAGVTVKGSVTVLDKGELEVSGAIEAKGFAVSGNGSRDGTKITIHNGASLKSEETTAIYHPQDGTLIIGDEEAVDGAAAPEITGVAGVVVRDGTVTVNDAQITATGDGPISVGDAKDAEGNSVPVPAGGIVLDTSKGYNETAEGSKVDVKNAEIQAKDGQPTVTHTADGKDVVQDADTRNQGSVTVTDGTFKSGENGDSGVAEYLTGNEDGTKGIDPTDGTIKERDETWPDANFEVDNKYYANLDDAINAVTNDPIINVLKSVEVKTSSTISKTIVLMSNDDVTISGVGRILEVEAETGNLTIRGNVSIVSTDETEDENIAAIKVSGTLSVSTGVSIEADDTAIYVASKGKLNMTGGTVTSNNEIAISTNGNDTTNPATITISGGTVTGADTASGVYVPAGQLTVSGKAVISGGAGIVVRGNGKAEVTGGTVSATSEEPVKVGDATTELDPRAVVVDAPKATENTAKVSGGTFEANGTPDYSVINYVETSDYGVDQTGTIQTAEAVKDDLFIVDFGYIANKETEIGEAGDNWVSDGGIVYKTATAQWGDATFYFAFNREITSDELSALGGSITVKFTCGEIEVSDTITAVGIRYASSFNNNTQLGDDLNGKPMTGGNYTIGCGDESATFAVPESIESAKVTLPETMITASGAPEISPAPTANKEGTVEDTDDYTVVYTGVDKESKTYSVAIDATNVKEHLNGAEPAEYGYWTGMALKKGADASDIKGYYAKIGDGAWQYSTLDAIEVDGEESYACIYFKDLGEYTVELVWTTDTKLETSTVETLDKSTDKMTFKVTVDITHGQSERPTTPAAGGGSSTTSKVTKPENGSVELSSTTARGGQTVTATVTPDEGYDVGEVIVKDRNGNPVEVTKNDDGTYSYTVPAGKTPVTVEVVFDECLCDDFADLDLDEWYHEAVDYAIRNELMLGQGDGWHPTDAVRSAEIFVILGRLDGAGLETGGDKWYEESLAWAMEKGYTDGSTPLANCSRERAVTLLWRYYGEQASDADITGFVDAADVSDWALDAMKWAVENEIIKGLDNNDIQPKKDLTRAEFATILERLEAAPATETAE